MITAGITADPLGILAAFGAGILSFLSPCVLPLVPGYVSMVSGLSAAELRAGRGTPAAASVSVAAAPVAASVSGVSVSGGVAVADPPVAIAGAAGGPPAPVSGPLRPLLQGIGLFVAGFTLVFVALGAAASGLGRLLDAHKDTLTTVSGAVVLVMGVVLLVSALPPAFWARLGGVGAGTVGRLFGERRFHVRASTLGIWAAPLMGMAFAFAWTPCIGPVLAAVLTLGAARSTLAGGVVLLFAYSLGLGVPFLVTGLAFGRLTSLYGRARRGLWVVNLIGGGVLVVFGVLLVSGQLSWLSSQFAALLTHLGLERLTTS